MNSNKQENARNTLSINKPELTKSFCKEIYFGLANQPDAKRFVLGTSLSQVCRNT